ncbi:Tigger transposable element-derived protein 4 [Acanthosepion pharaonis]|uniref:Tigger transposable element-derived protein 4 n=1 Tax=Acanthosepion pharaonis TaxID=158019 RepID=A0A812CLH6_ACAPH|nr:Tigger transposable element-derived protein 4 [Sepia pharaonis]
MRWKQANNISFKKLHGESTSADHGSANEWVTNVLPQLFRGYDPKDVWNCDETGIFYKAMPSGSLRFAGEEQSNGTKVPKDRLTMLQFTNMDDSEKQAVVVGKSAKPRCFKNVKTLPFSYFANRKAWMTSQLFTDVMKMFDRKMIAQNRKIILFLDNETYCRVQICQISNCRSCHQTPPVSFNLWIKASFVHSKRIIVGNLFECKSQRSMLHRQCRCPRWPSR